MHSSDANTTVTLSPRELYTLCFDAVRGVGARTVQAELLAAATLEAEERGRHLIGASHLIDFLEGFRDGRIETKKSPKVHAVSPVLYTVDCRAGLAHEGFADVRHQLIDAAHTNGIAVASLHHHYPAGELGHFVRQLAHAGLMSMVCGNSTAALQIQGSHSPVFGTNPMAFGAPVGEKILLTDQAASATAWVQVRQALENQQPLPEGAAVNAGGQPTTNPEHALEGSLLPFGGYKGGNIALLIEMLATLSGALFSTESPAFDAGEENPGLGLFICALDPNKFGRGYERRLYDALTEWSQERGADISRWFDRDADASAIELDAETHRQLLEFA